MCKFEETVTGAVVYGVDAGLVGVSRHFSSANHRVLRTHVIGAHGNINMLDNDKYWQWCISMMHDIQYRIHNVQH